MSTPIVLFVDDEPHILRSLQRQFRRATFEVLTANSAQEALETLTIHPIRVVVSDFKMPDLLGTQFLARVRQLYPNIHRILLTGFTDEPTILKARETDDELMTLSKPWDETELRASIESCLNR